MMVLYKHFDCDCVKVKRLTDQKQIKYSEYLSFALSVSLVDVFSAHRVFQTDPTLRNQMATFRLIKLTD